MLSRILRLWRKNLNLKKSGTCAIGLARSFRNFNLGLCQGGLTSSVNIFTDAACQSGVASKGVVVIDDYSGVCEALAGEFPSNLVDHWIALAGEQSGHHPS